MATLSTKLLIADALVELCETDKLNKISVSDIIEMTGKNRKTFYYHFEDKESLIIWKFRYDLGQELLATFPADILIYEDPIDKTNEDYKDFPYYLTQKSGVRSLDHSAFFDAYARVLHRHRAFYSQAFLETGPHSLRDYLYNLYLPALKNDIHIVLANRYLPEENINFLAEFYTCAFIYYFIRRYDQPNSTHAPSHAGPFANIIHSSMESEIKEAQLRRNL